MKGYLKALATFVILLGVMLLIVIIISLFFPNADLDYEKMGSASMVLAVVITFAMAKSGKKKSKDKLKDSLDSDI